MNKYPTHFRFAKGLSTDPNPQHRLAIADNRTAWFEAIRDVHDPLLQPLVRAGAPKAADYLGEFPTIDETEEKLSTCKRKIQKIKELKRRHALQQQCKERFTQGLLGCED